MKRSTILFPMLLTASVLFGQRAVARSTEPTEVRTEIVRYGDLDLTSPAGIATLDRRIAQAVLRVCSDGDAGVRARWSEQRCRREARRAASPQRSFALARANSGSVVLASRR